MTAHQVQISEMFNQVVLIAFGWCVGSREHLWDLVVARVAHHREPSKEWLILGAFSMTGISPELSADVAGNTSDCLDIQLNVQ